jgi:hypothetical protein
MGAAGATSIKNAAELLLSIGLSGGKNQYRNDGDGDTNNGECP